MILIGIECLDTFSIGGYRSEDILTSLCTYNFSQFVASLIRKAPDQHQSNQKKMRLAKETITVESRYDGSNEVNQNKNEQFKPQALSAVCYLHFPHFHVTVRPNLNQKTPIKSAQKLIKMICYSSKSENTSDIFVFFHHNTDSIGFSSLVYNVVYVFFYSNFVVVSLRFRNTMEI